jgi:hypothetical protein
MRLDVGFDSRNFEILYSTLRLCLAHFPYFVRKGRLKCVCYRHAHAF